MAEEVKAHEGSCKGYHCWHLGYKFLKWGIGFFLFGLFFGFGVFIYYLAGAHYPNSAEFLSNITLWFGSPLSLSVLYLELGGLGMAAAGGACLALARKESATATNEPNTGSVCKHKGKHASLILCNIGLIALFITGYIGYFIIDAIWNAFYYIPIPPAKNLWIVLQGLSVLCYFIGLLIGFSSLCCHHKNKCNHK